MYLEICMNAHNHLISVLRKTFFSQFFFFSVVVLFFFMLSYFPLLKFTFFNFTCNINKCFFLFVVHLIGLQQYWSTTTHKQPIEIGYQARIFTFLLDWSELSSFCFSKTHRLLLQHTYMHTPTFTTRTTRRNAGDLLLLLFHDDEYTY